MKPRRLTHYEVLYRVLSQRGDCVKVEVAELQYERRPHCVKILIETHIYTMLWQGEARFSIEDTRFYPLQTRKIAVLDIQEALKVLKEHYRELDGWRVESQKGYQSDIYEQYYKEAK